MPKLPIIYASTSGNVEAVSQFVSKHLNSKGYETSLHRAEVTSIKEIMDHPIVLFATSTWEHGEINPFFKPLLEDIGKANLSQKRAGFIGLGDRRYEEVFFCQGVEILKNAWETSGGRSIGTTLKVNGDPYVIMQTVIKDWASQFSDVLGAQNALIKSVI